MRLGCKVPRFAFTSLGIALRPMLQNPPGGYFACARQPLGAGYSWGTHRQIITPPTYAELRGHGTGGIAPLVGARVLRGFALVAGG